MLRERELRTMKERERIEREREKDREREREKRGLMGSFHTGFVGNPTPSSSSVAGPSGPPSFGPYPQASKREDSAPALDEHERGMDDSFPWSL